MNTPRLMLAAASSGCGKTTVACAILQALKVRGISCVSYKCGPDYIDPMFHRGNQGQHRPPARRNRRAGK